MTLRHIGSALIILCSFCGLFLQAVSPVYAEHLYHWTDPTGTKYYSNVAPPDDIRGYTTVIVPVSISGGSGSDNVASGTTAPKKLKPTANGSGSDDYSFRMKLRITALETSIHRIESLLIKHPNDAVLRRRISRKKQYLHEDLIRMQMPRK